MDKTNNDAGVTQADREAAEHFVEAHGWLCEDEWSDMHENDRATIAKSFARHRQQAIAQHEGEPAALAEQACLISKSGCVVTLDCDDPDEANELFDWLSEAKYLSSSRQFALAQGELIEIGVQAALDAGLAVNGEYGVAAARHSARTVLTRLASTPATPAQMGEDEIADTVERIIFGRVLSERVAGYTLETAREIAKALVPHLTQQAEEVARLQSERDAAVAEVGRLREALAYMIRAYDYESDVEDTLLMVKEGAAVFSVASARSLLETGDTSHAEGEE